MAGEEIGVYRCEAATDETAYFIYCWENRCYHDSGYAADAWARAHRFRVSALEEMDRLGLRGPQVIRPGWPVDYVAEVAKLRGEESCLTDTTA